jgi:hypothetical protein
LKLSEVVKTVDMIEAIAKLIAGITLASQSTRSVEANVSMKTQA